MDKLASLEALRQMSCNNEAMSNMLSRVALQIKRVGAWIKILGSLRLYEKVKVISLLNKSKSQIQQEILVLLLCDFKRSGYFVEFGATDGISLSNTFILESHFGWTGILAEPGRNWHEQLFQNRQCHVDTSCIWQETGEHLEFLEASKGEYSTIEKFTMSDHHSRKRISNQTYRVKTLSLEDLLDRYQAPTTIDYLSIDTEGSEYEILSHFNFKKYQIKVITVEHNYSAKRDEIKDLLTMNGYERINTSLSLWDDWYVLSEFVRQSKFMSMVE